MMDGDLVRLKAPARWSPWTCRWCWAARTPARSASSPTAAASSAVGIWADRRRSAPPGGAGVKEVTLLGQIVDRYGKDILDGPDLAALTADRARS